MDWVLIYILIGIVVGFIAGMLGIGGGTTLVPLLVFVFTAEGFSGDKIIHLALGTTITSIIFTSISSIKAHHSRGVVRWDIFRKGTPSLILGTLSGTFVADILNSISLAIFFVAFVYLTSIQLFFDSKKTIRTNFPGITGICITGFFIGVISSLVGAGGGVLSIPLMVLCGIPIIQAVGTSAALGLPIALAGSAGYIYHGLGEPLLPSLSVGYIYIPALIGITIGTFFTVPIGARVAHRIPANYLKKIFAILLFFLATRMAWEFLS